MTDNTNSNNNDDAEKMRLAFEQFMLSGGKNNKNNNNNNNNSSQANRTNDEASTPQSTSNKSKKKKKKKRQSTSSSSGPTPTKVVATPTTKQQTSQSPPSQQSTTTTTTPNPKIKKRYYQLLRSYTDKIKHTWMDIDEQLLSVLQNVGSIRGRLPYEWKVFSQQVLESKWYRHQEGEEDEVDGWLESPEQEEEIDDGNEDDWKSHGFQQHSKISSSLYLQIDDIQLALSHDLEQHEKMLVGLRSLMSNLAECHDALGRVVDSMWQYHFEIEDDNEETEKNEGMRMRKDNDILEHIVTCVTESYQMLSMELYRKQNLIALVIESTKDEIFGMNDELPGKRPNHGGTKSQKLVRECCTSWKRSFSDEELLLNVMKLGES